VSDTQPKTTLPTFTPVPRLKDRHNGWKPEVQRAFIEALAETGSVRAACRRVGRSEHGVYQMRRHPEAGEFRAAWDAALDLGVRRIEDAAMDRALYGTEETIHYHGELVATRRRYNERLVMFILRNRAPDRFAGGKAGSLSALDKATLKKLKAEWRKEWEQARAIEKAAEARAAGDGFLEKVKSMHRAWYCGMSPTTRAAYRAFREAEEADSADGHAWLHEDDAEPLSVAEAEYEELFARPRDRRSHAHKLVDMRVWEEGENGEDAEEDADEDTPSSSPRA
jgi:hypothetical protein